MSFENSMKNLEEISSKIRDENTTLDDALKFYEEGMKEYDTLKKILDETNQKIEIIESGENNG